MNVELLQQIKAQILAEPDRFRMDKWNCGSAQCIAGWACTLTGATWVTDSDDIVRLEESDVWTAWDDVCMHARRVLDIDCAQSWRLFLDAYWPFEFFKPYDAATTRSERAAIAAARIDAFIASDGNDGNDPVEGEPW